MVLGQRGLRRAGDGEQELHGGLAHRAGALRYWLEGRWHWRRVWNLLPFVLLAAASAWLAAWTQGLDIAGRADWQRGWPERLAVAGRIIWFYLGKLAWPHPLIFIYPRWKIDTSNPISYVPLLAVIVTFAVLWHWRRGWARETWFAFTYFIVALLPVLDLVNHYFVRYSFVGDHFQYLASMGILALAGGAAARLLARFGLWRRWSGDGLCLLLLLALAGLTWQQSRMYENDDKLYRATLARNPTCWLAHNNLGKMLVERGEVDEAIDHYQQAMEAEPRVAEPPNNLGLALLKKGRTEEAIDQYHRAIELDPQYAVAYHNLGLLLAQLGQSDAALLQFQKTLDVDPDYAEAHMNIGLILAARGQLDDAIDRYRKALEIRPDLAMARINLGVALDRQGKIDDAIAQYRKVVEMAPTFAEAHFKLAFDLVGRGQVNEAMAHFRKAAELKPDYAEAHYSLGVMLAGRGQIEAAAAEYRKALAIKPDYAAARRRLDALRGRRQ